ncbi:MAG: NAD-glutamate dehydrogenase [Alphaproteobacteria bacterium]|nr:NAD-glutamate dehydrogenase [Alphaproteobacteria bacterium]
MSIQKKDKTSDPFKTLIAQAKDLLPKNASPRLIQMLEVISSRISVSDLEFFNANILKHMACHHWDMAKCRKAGEPELQIYCPELGKGDSRKTIIDIVSDDVAFLVDSIAAEINKHNHLIGILIYPVLYTKYDKKSDLLDISSTAKEGYVRQAHIHVQINETLSNTSIKELKKGFAKVLEDVYHANRDWQKMLGKLKNASEELNAAKTRRPATEIQEYCAFLDYLYDNNFTLLGYREYLFGKDKKGGPTSKTVKGSGLGVLNDDVTPAYISDNKEGLPRNMQELRISLPPVSVSKTNKLATVHRRVPMDCIAVKIYDDKGSVIGEKLFLGLFTSVTYSRSVCDVPLIRKLIEDVVELSGFVQGSHNRKALRHILEKYPRDELFQIEPKALFKICENIIRLQERQRIALFMRKDPFKRYISCLVYIPRDRYGTDLRKDFSAILEQETNGQVANFYTTLDDSVFARIMFIIKTSQTNTKKIDIARIEHRLRENGQTWSERLFQALTEAYTDDKYIAAVNFRYAEAFPVGYASHYLAKQAVFDIEKVEEALECDNIVLDLYRPNDISENCVRLKVYHVGSPIILSDVLPILENMGLRVIAELPFEIRPNGGERAVWIHDFLLETSEVEGGVDIDEVKKDFESAFIQIWNNMVENDTLNRLTLSAKINWHEIMVLRSYVRYMRQLRFPFSSSYIEKALTDHPEISHMIIDLFKGLLDPKKNTENKLQTFEKLAAPVLEELENVVSSDQDRILRMMVGLVQATLRTNYYQCTWDGSDQPYLSLKFDSSMVPDMPDPRPFREIFVYSTRVEAVHLRGDMIARGGLRWSDRHEDFRTEVLGLMKAQMVKNAVIVPMGAKGGFIVKTPTDSREEFFKEGVECYKTFIRAMLDITDNQKGSKIIPPENVVRRDGDDPYLVVAADKGTATFSDIANGLSQEYGFWLDDAFASGGSAGYDHKKMGITARGAWESVKFHFRLLNHDIQNQPFDVVGIGDMGGDVFGNGMLLSKHIQLIAAFNHVHIFCDPSPDAAATFKERKRLFETCGGWDQYNEKLLSKGGRIYKRSDKTLELTPEIQKRFDIQKQKVTPTELIKAILKSRTDLLWFGGIGTYIKSGKETHADVGDKTNDSLRVNASDVRAKVVGEGANLAITQLGRIELAERDVRLNTDFLDNSAGVDSSDHEVNIKILLSDVMAQKENKMDIKVRNALLEKMTEEVADHVLRHNYQQTQAISLADFQAHENLQIQEEFIQDMERDQGLNREIEGLPDQEAVELRTRTGKGLTRPELCVLQAYAKINLTQELLDSDIPDNPEMEYWLIDYFPEILGKKYTKEILRHRLRREIIATMMSNSLINRMGPTFLKSRMKKTGKSINDITQAYLIVRDVFDLRDLWDKIEALEGNVVAGVQLKAMREIALLAEHSITWFLTRLGRDMDLKKDVQEFSGGVKDLSKAIDRLTTESVRASIRRRTELGIKDGLPHDIAYTIALMPILSSACDIIRISGEQNTDLRSTARTYFELGERLHFDWLRQQARFLPHEGRWQAEAVNGLIDQFFSSQAGLTVRILRDMNGNDSGRNTSMFEKWISMHGHNIAQLDSLFSKMRVSGASDLTMLTVAEQRLRSLYGG